MVKENNKYIYVRGSRHTDHGSRVYDIAGEQLPSVTTILSRTKDQRKLNEWKAKVGEQRAEEIKNLSSRRGTAMHKFIEAYLLQKGYEDLTDLGIQAKSMAEKIIEIGLAPVEEWYGTEVTLFYPGLYAGATDLVCNHNGLETIVDFKQANKPKRAEWIEDYFMQVAAYAMAHDHVYGSRIRQAVVMICTPDLYYHEFKIQDQELREWKHRFLVRLNMYYNLKVN
tara:strand:- start:897 stop:1571 length:675 start_codon:yes stop_codon:yes gene_type:complete